MMRETASVEQARQLLRQGRVREAERLYADVLHGAPDHLEALNALGIAALRAKDLARARALLGRAVTLAPDEQASRLYLAIALEQSGEDERATLHYARALNDAQARGRWLNADTTPRPLRPMVERAVRAVRAGSGRAFAAVLEPLAARYGRSSLERVEQCLRIYLREEPPVLEDERQQPSFLFFPGLGAAPYLDRSLFDWIDVLEADTGAIRAELLRLLPGDTGRERVFDSEALEQTHLRGLDVPPSWNGYYFYRHGIRREDNCASCPATAGALERLPLARVRDHGPEVLYSVFTPGTHLLPHRGVTNTRLVAHLPLIVPERCALRVGGEVHSWQEGRVVVFDDTYEHEAWNRSRHTRVVMIFDVWHPRLTEAERLAVTHLVAAIGDLRKAVEAA